MATEKILKKIREEVKSITEGLELFLDQDVQPSVTDCEGLQKQLTDIQESIAVYKFQKKEKEISPSFNIHAKVSEKAADITIVKEQIIPEQKTEITFQKPLEKEIINHTEKKIAPLVIGINDKFRFINELFKQNNSEYNIAIEQLSSLQSWIEADIYLTSLKGLYDWNDNSDVVTYFYSVIKKRFT